MPAHSKEKSKYLPEGIVEIKIYTTREVKSRIMASAKSENKSITDYCSPVIVALANGDIVSKVVDLRKK